SEVCVIGYVICCPLDVLVVYRLVRVLHVLRLLFRLRPLHFFFPAPSLLFPFLHYTGLVPLFVPPCLNAAHDLLRPAWGLTDVHRDRKSTRLNSSHVAISYAVFCLKKKTTTRRAIRSAGERQKCGRSSLGGRKCREACSNTNTYAPATPAGRCLLSLLWCLCLLPLG